MQRGTFSAGDVMRCATPWPSTEEEASQADAARRTAASGVGWTSNTRDINVFVTVTEQYVSVAFRRLWLHLRATESLNDISSLIFKIN